MKALQRITATAALTAALVGCAGYGPGQLRVGQDASAVTASMGQPTGRYALPEGQQRLEFARGPFGLHTYMIDLGADGKVRSIDQVLTEARFNAIAAGQTGEQVMAMIGRPSHRRPGGWPGGQVWAWRYDSLFCTWFMASIGDDGKVRDTGYGPDPRCEDPVGTDK